jgi:hypothetical protein
LPDWVEGGYQIMSAEITDISSEGLPRDCAREELLTHAEFPDETSDVEHAIEHPLNSGWLYDVYSRPRITDPEMERDEI